MELFRVVGEDFTWCFRSEGVLFVFHNNSTEEVVNYSKRWRFHDGKLQFYNLIRENSEYWRDFEDSFHIAYETFLNKVITEET